MGNSFENPISSVPIYNQLSKIFEKPCKQYVNLYINYMHAKNLVQLRNMYSSIENFPLAISANKGNGM